MMKSSHIRKVVFRSCRGRRQENQGPSVRASVVLGHSTPGAEGSVGCPGEAG